MIFIKKSWKDEKINKSAYQNLKHPKTYSLQNRWTVTKKKSQRKTLIYPHIYLFADIQSINLTNNLAFYH